MASLDELWLDTLNQLCGRAAHDVKGALNGVSVNLEVVRSRSEKPGSPSSAVSRYAVSASQQLTQVIEMTEAVLAFARRASEPFPLAPVLRRMTVLLRPGLETAGRTLELIEPLPDLGSTSVPGAAVRLAVGAALLAATDASGRVVCSGEAVDGTATIQIDHGGASLPSLSPDLLACLRGEGLRYESSKNRITITVPRLSSPLAP